MEKYSEVLISEGKGILTNMLEFDEFISNDGGVPEEAVILLTGTSGAGKTTISAKLQKHLNQPSVLYSREMLKGAVKKQTKRMNIVNENAYICDESNYKHFNDFLNKMYEERPKVIIVDSLQHVARDFEKEMGENKAQIHVLTQLIAWRNVTKGTVIIIGHVTKEGGFAGLNTIKHDIDVHLHLSFNEKTKERKMETTKNRFGSLGELYYDFIESEDAVKFLDGPREVNLSESISAVLDLKLKQLKKSGQESLIKEYKKFIANLSDDLSESQMIIEALLFLSKKEIF